MMKDTQIQAIKEEASILADEGDCFQSIKLANTILPLLPLDPQIHALLCYGYTETRKFKLAKKHLKAAIELDPNNTQTRLVEAHYLMRRNKFKISEIKLIQLCESAKTDLCYIRLVDHYATHYRLLKSSLLRRPGKKKAILLKLNKTIDTYAQLFQCPYNAETLRLKSYVQIGAYKMAHLSVGRCIAHNPNEPQHYFVQAYLYIMQAKPEFARKAVQQGLRFAPADPWGLDLFSILKLGLVKNKYRKFVERLIYYGSIIIVVVSLSSHLATILLVKLFALGIGLYERSEYKRYRKTLSTITLNANF